MEDRDGKKEEVSLHSFLADLPEDCACVERKKGILGQPVARAISSCWLPDPLGLQALKNAFKVDTVNSMSSLLPPSIWKKVCTRSKIGQGTRLVPGKSQGS